MPFCKKCGHKLESDAVFCPQCGSPIAKTDDNEQAANPEFEKTRQRTVDAAAISRPENLPEGYVIDQRYRVKRKLGQGGFGAVYLVDDRKLGVEKALKVIPEAITNDPEALDQLQREARVMLSLNHPNIVRVYDFHDEGSYKYIDMEYVDGQTLTEIKLTRPDRRLPEEEVLGYAREIATALAYAHGRNILHRDLKPQNVMVTESGEVKVMDFGIAETVRSSMSRIAQTTSSGTLVYMSPEQLRGKDVGKESDIYSFGAMLYDLLSGHPPFYRGDIQYQILNEEPEEIVGVSDNLNQVLIHCLLKDYVNRYDNFTNLTKMLQVKESSPVDLPKQTQLGTKKNKANLKRPNVSNTKSHSEVCSLDVSSTITGVGIYINGKYSGKNSPDTISGLSPGEYIVELKGEKHFSNPTSVLIEPRETKRCYPDLHLYGYLNIKSSYKELFVNIVPGEKRIVPGYDVSLTPGTYQLKPSLSFLPEVEIQIKPRKKETLDYNELTHKRQLTVRTGGLAAYFTLKAVELISSENHSIKKGENTSIILKLLPGTYAFSLSNRLGGRLLYSKTIDLKTQDAVIDIEKQLRKRKNNRIILWSSFSCAVVLSLGAFLFFNSPTMPIGVVIANTTTLRSGFYKQAPSQLTLVKDEEVLILQHWKPPSPNCLIVVDQSTNLETKNGYRYLQPGSVVYMIAELKNKYLVSYKNDNSEIIGSIKPEQVATPSDGSWLKIKTKTDIEGWLPSKYISIKSQ